MSSVILLNICLKFVSVNSIPIESNTKTFVTFYCTNSYNNLVVKIHVLILYYKLDKKILV